MFEVVLELGWDCVGLGLEDLDEELVWPFGHGVGGAWLVADVGHRDADLVEASDDAFDPAGLDAEVVNGRRSGGTWWLVVEMDAAGTDSKEDIAGAGDLEV